MSQTSPGPHAVDLGSWILVGWCSSAHNLVLMHLGLWCPTNQPRRKGENFTDQPTNQPTTASKEGSMQKFPLPMTCQRKHGCFFMRYKNTESAELKDPPNDPVKWFIGCYVFQILLQHTGVSNSDGTMTKGFLFGMFASAQLSCCKLHSSETCKFFVKSTFG